MSAGARVGRTPGGSGSDGDMLWQGFHAARPHAVCAVQTFQNPGTGPMLYMFVQYWYRVGWGVVVYDRYGMHRDFIKDMLHWPGFYYHPYTVYSITQPGKYTVQLQEAAGNENKVAYFPRRTPHTVQRTVLNHPDAISNPSLLSCRLVLPFRGVLRYREELGVLGQASVRHGGPGWGQDEDVRLRADGVPTADDAAVRGH